MRRKIFIGINLDPHVKKMLTRSTKKWYNLPIKWHKENSLHISLIPIGWVSENDVFAISDAIVAVASELENFDIAFDKITTISKKDSDDIKDAQAVRLVGVESNALKELFEKLEKELGMPFVKKKHFKPVVTLGRMRAKKWQELEDFPEINFDFPVVMDVSVVTLFESVQIDGKWTIEPIDIFELK